VVSVVVEAEIEKGAARGLGGDDPLEPLAAARIALEPQHVSAALLDVFDQALCANLGDCGKSLLERARIERAGDWQVPGHPGTKVS